VLSANQIARVDRRIGSKIQLSDGQWFTAQIPLHYQLGIELSGGETRPVDSGVKRYNSVKVFWMVLGQA
jgi:hypothetical protein